MLATIVSIRGMRVKETNDPVLNTNFHHYRYSARVEEELSTVRLG